VSAASLGYSPSPTTTAHIRRTLSCERCGAKDVRVTYESAGAGVHSRPSVLIAASCTNEECEWYDRRTKRRDYPAEAVARVAEAAR